MTDLTAHSGPSTDLTIGPEQTAFTEKQVAALRQLGVQGASNADLAVFFHQSVRTGLDPFARQIYMIERQGKQTIQTGIDGFRLIARRATDRAGGTLGFQPTEWCGEDGVWRDVWLSDKPPAAARVVVLRDGQPFPGLALLHEYAGRKRDGSLMAMWASKPALMLAKCAEALALRRAFPQDLSGIYTSDEMSAADRGPTTIPGRVEQVEQDTRQGDAEPTPQEYAAQVVQRMVAATDRAALNDVWKAAAAGIRFSWASQYPGMKAFAEAQTVTVPIDGTEATLSLFDAFVAMSAGLPEAAGPPAGSGEDVVDAEVVEDVPAQTTTPTAGGAERVTVNDAARAADEDPWATPTSAVPTADEAVASWVDARERGRDAAEDAGRPRSGKGAGRAAYDAAKAATRAAAEQQKAEREADAAERTAPRTAPPGRSATITKGTDA